MKARRIALVLNRLPVGGLERVAVDIATNLVRHGRQAVLIRLEGPPHPHLHPHPHAQAHSRLTATSALSASPVVGPWEGQSDTMAAQAAAQGVEVVDLLGRLPARPNLGTARLLAALIHALRCRQVDLVQTHLFTSGILGGAAARILGIPMVHVEQNEYAWKKTLATAMERLVWPRRTVVACPSRVVADCHARRLRLGTDSVRVIPNGVCTPGEMPSREEARARLGLPADLGVVGLVERLVPVKCQVHVIEAMARLVKVRPHVRLVIAGDGPHRGTLESRARELGLLAPAGTGTAAVHFLGELSDPWSIRPAFDVAVTASQHEGFGLTVAESMAAGTPIVVPDLPIFREVAAGAAELFPAGDVIALTATLHRLLGDAGARAELRAQGHRRVEQLFRLDVMVDRYEQLYDDLVNSPAGAARNPDQAVHSVDLTRSL